MDGSKNVPQRARFLCYTVLKLFSPIPCMVRVALNHLWKHRTAAVILAVAALSITISLLWVRGGLAAFTNGMAATDVLGQWNANFLNGVQASFTRGEVASAKCSR